MGKAMVRGHLEKSKKYMWIVQGVEEAMRF
jgi:hypothetical protein